MTLQSCYAKYWKQMTSNCGGQGYDNEVNMAGKHTGVQAIRLEKNPVFSLCSTHSLNLCGVHAAKCSVDVKYFFGNVQKLYTLFGSNPRWKDLQENARLSLHQTLVGALELMQ